MYPATINNPLPDLQKLVHVKQRQLQALLDITQAINENRPSEILFDLYRQVIAEQLGVMEFGAISLKASCFAKPEFQ